MRAGRYKDAKAELEAALAAVDKKKSSPAYLWYVLAIVESKLGNLEEGREHLQKANQLCDQELATSNLWNRMQILKLVRSEAEKLAGPK